jgi:hypothetical protein
MANGGNLLYYLEGMYDAGILVFLLLFTIIFAVLQKTNILGAGKKRFNIVVSLVMSLIVVVPHMVGYYPNSYDVVDIINRALPDVSLIAVAAIMLLLLIGLFGGEAKWMGGSFSGIIAIVAFIIVGVIFASSAGWLQGFYIYDFIDADTLTLLLIILVFAIIVWFITREDTKEEGMAFVGNALEEIGNFFGGKR